MRKDVTLTKQKVKSRKNGKEQYRWQLRWYDLDGKRRSENVGKTPTMSERKARKLAQQKELQLGKQPSLRRAGKAPTLHAFCDQYLIDRKHELAAGTLNLHGLTARYLKVYFGKVRRMDEITRTEARSFKTALLDGELGHATLKKSPRRCTATTCDSHMRNSRAIFNRAIDDDLIESNPFSRMTGGIEALEKSWAYVNSNDLNAIMDACPDQNWKLLFALCRLAGLRRGEALDLNWSAVDLEKKRFEVIASKTNRRRVVPIAPELLLILNEVFDDEPPGSGPMIGDLGVERKDIYRPAIQIVKASGLEAYSKPFHTLRKNREQDWNDAGIPFHVVVEWMGHSDTVAKKHYLRVDDHHMSLASKTVLKEK